MDVFFRGLVGIPRGSSGIPRDPYGLRDSLPEAAAKEQLSVPAASLQSPGERPMPGFNADLLYQLLLERTDTSQ